MNSDATHTPSSPESFVDRLVALNAKERHHLLAFVYGARDGRMVPHPDFVRGVVDAIKLRDVLDADGRVRDGACTFAAMDYHLEWLYAAVLGPAIGETRRNGDEAGVIVKGSQEDVDFLLVLEGVEATHVVLVEAKGIGKFTAKQLGSKLGRLRRMWAHGMADAAAAQCLRFHVLLLAPDHSRAPDELLAARMEDAPEWASPIHQMTLTGFPTRSTLRLVMRCKECFLAAARSDRRRCFGARSNASSPSRTPAPSRTTSAPCCCPPRTHRSRTANHEPLNSGAIQRAIRRTPLFGEPCGPGPAGSVRRTHG